MSAYDSEKEDFMKKFQQGFFDYMRKKDNGRTEKIYEIAAAELNGFFEKICTNDKGQIGGDMLLNYVSRYAGISCLMAALRDGRDFAAGEKESISLAVLNTECGIFYMGESINQYIFYRDDSMYKHLLAGIGANEDQYNKRIEEILAECTGNYGNPHYRLWDGQINQYEIKKQDAEGYGKLLMVLGKYKFDSEQVYRVYGYLLESVIKRVKQVFPKNQDPLLLGIKNVIFYSHMESRR